MADEWSGYLSGTSPLLDRALAGISGKERLAWFVPGRIELLGKHTDYAGGRSLLCAAERGLYLAASARADGLVRMTSGGSAVLIDPARMESGAPGDWGNYGRVVVRRIIANFPQAFVWAEIAVAGDLPAAAGMSSSSALVVGIFLALAEINRLAEHGEYRRNIRTAEDLAGYLGAVEGGKAFGSLEGERGVGTSGGSEDHVAILCSEAGRVAEYRFCPIERRRMVAFPEDYCIAIAFSGVAARKSGEARERFNELAAAAGRLMEYGGGGRLERSAELVEMLSRRGETELLARLEQYGRECDAVERMAELISRGEMDAIGEIVDESQGAAERVLRNQTRQTIGLAASARRLGAAAASAFGAGFGGSVWAMARTSGAEAFLKEWSQWYRATHPVEAERGEFFLTRPGGPARRLL